MKEKPYSIAVVAGDGIGPEITGAAVRVLEKVGEAYGHTFLFESVLAGGAAIDAAGEPLPRQTVETCLKSDSVLLGAVGGPKWDTLPGSQRPERALLGLRKALGLYANIRPARLMPELSAACPLREDIAQKGFDMVIVRELTGGMYFGERGRRKGALGPEAYDTECYSEHEIERIGVKAFELARRRKKRLISVDKANVLETSRLWREVMHRLHGAYLDVDLADMLVDNAAMQLIKDPAQFDVVVTSNLFGDILSDEASQLTGSIGLLPSASLGEGRRGLYEPIHGSAPDIAGQDRANPIATVLSTAMMLRLSFDLEEEAAVIERAVAAVLREGCRTADIARGSKKALGCRAMTDTILARI